MSTQHSENRPDIGRMTTQLAADNIRIDRFIDSLPGHVDQIVTAALDEDWNEIRRQSNYLADGGMEYGYTQLAQSARDLSEVMTKQSNDIEMRRGVVKFIGAYGRTARPKLETTSEKTTDD